MKAELKRWLAIFLALITVVGSVPMDVLASGVTVIEETEEIQQTVEENSEEILAEPEENDEEISVETEKEAAVSDGETTGNADVSEETKEESMITEEVQEEDCDEEKNQDFEDTEVVNDKIVDEEQTETETVLVNDEMVQNEEDLVLAASSLTPMNEEMEFQAISSDYYHKKGTLDLDGETLTVYGDFYLQSGTVDVNGGTLEIQGDLHVLGGCLQLNEGTITVNGNAYIAEKISEKDYEDVYAEILMENEEDRITIIGDLITCLEYGEGFECYAGIMEIGGDWINYSCDDYYELCTYDDFEVIFTGKDELIIDGDQGIFVPTMTIKNSSDRKITIRGMIGVDTLKGGKMTISVENNPELSIKMITGNIVINGDVILNALSLLGYNMQVNGNLCVNGNVTLGLPQKDKQGCLSVTGDFLVTGGIFAFNCGKVTVGGDAYFNIVEEDGSYSPVWMDFRMEHELDEFIIAGDLTTNFCYGDQFQCYAGIMEIGGNWSNFSDYNEDALYGEEEFEVVFKGTKDLTIKGADGIYVPTMTIENASERKITIQGIVGAEILKGGDMSIIAKKFPTLDLGTTTGTLDIQGDVTLSVSTKTSDDITIQGNTVLDSLALLGHSMEIDGNLKIAGGEVTLGVFASEKQGVLSVTGELQAVNGSIRLNCGSIIVGGDAYFSVVEEDGSYSPVWMDFCMEHELDEFIIAGDLTTNFCYGDQFQCYAGIMEIGGNWSNFSDYNEDALYGEEEFEVVFKGTKDLTIKGADGIYVPTMTIENASERKITIQGIVGAENLKGGEMSVTAKKCPTLNLGETTGDLTILGDITLSAETLAGGNISVDGNLYSNGFAMGAKKLSVTGNLYLNSYDTLALGSSGALVVGGDVWMNDGIMLLAGTSKVKGNFYQGAGEVHMEKGTLEILRDYRIQAPDLNGEDWKCSEGVLYMIYDKAQVTVGGDFYMESEEGHGDYALEAGTLIVKGDFYQLSDRGGAEDNFVPGGTHAVKLAGTEHQTVTFESEESMFNILILTQNLDNYTFNPNPCWRNLKYDCAHSYESVATEPTCEERGYTTYTCKKCGESYIDNYIAALNHEDVIDKGYAATCEKAGLTDGKHCSRCEKTLVKQETIKPLGHAYKEKVTEPTCEEKGYTTYICARENCGHSYVGNFVEKLGHVEVIDKGYAATCEKAGLTDGKHCSRCEKTLVKQETIKLLGHAYKEEVTEPTCEEKGYTTYICTRENCEHSYVGNFVEKLGHAEVIDKGYAATCGKAGLTDGKHCSRCEKTFVKQETIKPLGHAYKEEVTEPTCEEKGYTTYICIREKCGYFYEDDYTEQIGHTWNDGEVTKQPTVTEEGIRTYTCMTCNATYDEVIPICEHTYNTEIIPPTCEEAGYIKYTCSKCNYSYKDENVRPLGHMVEKITGKIATCTEAGLTEGEVCSVCKKILREQVMIEPMGHTVVINEAVEATCTTGGVTEGRYCSVCKEVFAEQEETEALGHLLSEYIVNEDGTKTAVCENCGEEFVINEEIEDSEILENLQIILDKEYVLAELDECSGITASINYPGKITWSVEGKSIIISSSDDYCEFEAVDIGTSYIVACAYFGEHAVYARCRVDVTEQEPIETISGVHLIETSVTSKLYSNDYTKFEVSFDLAQNMMARTMLFSMEMEDSGVAIEDAYFTNTAVRELFDIRVVDDKNLEIVPIVNLNNASAIKAVKTNYKTQVTVVVDEKEIETTETLTITVDKKLPTVKAAEVKLNGFYTEDTKPLVFTCKDAKIVSAALDSSKEADEACPSWLTLNEDQSVSLYKEINSKVSGKLYLEVELEGYAIPVKVSATVTASKTVPKLKLSTSKATFNMNREKAVGTTLTILSGDKKVSYQDIGIENITVAYLESMSDASAKTYAASDSYEITDFDDETGVFTIDVAEGKTPVSGKVLLRVNVAGAEDTVNLALSVSVYRKKPTFILAKTSVTISPIEAPETSCVAVKVTPTPADYPVDAQNLTWTIKDSKNKEVEVEPLDISVVNNQIMIQSNGNAVAGAKYKVIFALDGVSKKVTLNVTIKTPSLKLAKTEVALSTVNALETSSFDMKVTPTPADYPINAKTLTWTIKDSKNRILENKPLDISISEGVVTIKANEFAAAGAKYKVLFTFGESSKAVILNVTMRTPTIKLAKTSVTLNAALEDSSTIKITSSPSDYRISEKTLHCYVGDSKNVILLEQPLDITLQDNAVKVAVNDKTAYGATYRVVLKLDETEKTTILTVKTLAESKSAVKLSISVKGKLETGYLDKSVTITPKWTSLTGGADILENIKIYEVKGGKANTAVDMTENFEITANENGTYDIKFKDADSLEKINPKAKYVVVTENANVKGYNVQDSKAISLTITHTKAKVNQNTKTVSLYLNDRYSQGIVKLSLKDKKMSKISKVELADSTVSAFYEIKDLGNNEFAICYKDCEIAEKIKAGTLKLRVYLEGNSPVFGLPNATISVKVKNVSFSKK